MNIDRSKHNKYTTSAVYGNQTTGGISTDEGGNVTGTGLQYSGNIIYIGGGGGIGGIDPDLMDQIMNQDAYSYLNISDGVYTVNAEAKQQKDYVNLNIVGDNETTETQVSKDKYLNKTFFDATGLKGGRYSVTYKKVLVPGEVGGEPVEIPKWVITLEKVFGTPIFVNTDFDGIQVFNKDIEVGVYSVNNPRVTVNSDTTTGLVSIIISNPEQLEFDELRIIKSGDYTDGITYTNVAVIKGIVIQEYITVTITQAGASKYWKLDDQGRLYTTYDTYVTKSFGAYDKIWTNYGYTVGNYVQGISGGAFYIVDQLQNTYLEVDKLKVRKKAYFETLEIVNVNSVGGKQIISPAGAVTLNKVEDKGTYYRCYFLGVQDGVEVENRFKKDDLAFSQNFNIKKPGEYEQVANHYFWRKVNAVSVDPDANGNHWIDLDKIDCDTDSDIPHVNDVVAQLGNKTDTDRQSAMIFSSVDVESPRIILCHGINNYSLSSKEYFDLGVNHLSNQAYMNVYGNSFIGARDGSTYVKYTQADGLNIKGHISASSTYGGKKFSEVFVTTENFDDSVKAVVGDELEYLQNQIDGNIESYFYEYSPTLTNYPANTWTTEADKQRHNGDTFTNIQKYIDDVTTPDAGKSWRWVKNANNVWGWTVISDSDAVLALKKAGEAQDTADGKRRVFTRKPETVDVYDIGDLWVNATYTDTVGMNVYSNDLLRAKKAKVKGIAFNITDWELASKYTDDTVANAAKQEAAQAQSAADSAASVAAAAKTRLDNWAADGTISPTEKQSLKDEIVRIDADKTDITGSYTKYGLGTPTAFNTAHANYRASLVNLTKALPESIAIPSDFATKQSTYYSERTKALQAIAAKAKQLVDNAQSAAQAAQAAATAAGAAANAAQTTINDYKDTIDDVFQDGIITASEKNRLNNLKDTVNTTLFDVQTTYNKVYNNANLAGKVQKTRLKTAYDAFSAAAKALTDAVTSILNKVNTQSYAITKGDIATVDNAYTNFNTKYTDYVGALGDANLEITTSISNTAYSNAVNKYAWLNGLFDPDQTTTIDGGVVTTGVLALGKTTSGVFKVNAGINGVSNTSYNGGGPAIWFGGDMLDKDNYSAGNRPANVATSMFRFDGSGYLGYKPNSDASKDQAPIWWDATGNIHANPLSFFVGEETVGLLLASFQAVDSNGDGNVDYVVQKAPFTYLQIGNGYIGYDAASNSVYVYVLDSSGNKQVCNFYAYGEITAYGAGTGGDNPAGAQYLDELKDVQFTNLKATQLMQYNGGKWVNIDTSSIIITPTWGNITNKPTTIAGYGITDAVRKTGDTMTGKLTISTATYGGQLEIKRLAAGSNAVIRYSNSDGNLGDIGICGTSGMFPNDLYFNKGGAGEFKIWHSGNDGTGSGLDADLLDGFQRTRFAGGYSSVGLGAPGTAYTYREFISAIGNDMNFAATVRRGSWDYDNNGYITTAFGNLPLAGLSSISFGTSGANTTLFISASTYSGVSNPLLSEMVFHIDNGDAYAPTWRRVLTHYNYKEYALPLTGGTLTGSVILNNGDFVKRMLNDTSNYEDAILWYMKASDTKIASIGYHNTVQKVYINPNGSENVYTDTEGKYSLSIGVNHLKYNTWNILHANNYNSYVPSLTGSGASGTWNISINGGSNYLFSRPLGTDFNSTSINRNGIWWWSDTATNNPPSGANFGVMLQISNQNIPTGGTSNHWINQLGWGTNDRLYVRQRINTGNFTSWRQLAYITDNVASATKLQTARTIWGNSFDGTANISGTLTVTSKPSLQTAGTVLINYSNSSGSGYDEGIRIVPSSNGWANVQFGAANAWSGYQAGQWCVGKNPSNWFVIGYTPNQSDKAAWKSGNVTIDPTGRLIAYSLNSYSTITSNYNRFNDSLAYYNTTTPSVTGTLCVTLPNGWNNSMNIYEIHLYEYNGNTHSVIRVSGYNYSSTPGWNNYGYEVKGGYSKGVRLGYNGSKNVILLGNTTSTWSYPQVFLKSVLTGFANQTTWYNDYSIGFITSESGYTNITTVSPKSEWFGSINAASITSRGNVSFTGDLTVTGKVGIGTTSPSATYKLHVEGHSYTNGWYYTPTAYGYYIIGGVYYRSKDTLYPDIISAGNEICFGGNSDTLYVNYRISNSGVAVKKWYWRAGSSTSWANFNIGALSVNGDMNSTGSAVFNGSVISNDYFKLNTIATVSNTWASVFQTNAGYQITTQQSVAGNTAQLMFGWQNVITSVGYITSYRIGSVRSSSGWGEMRFWVGDSDAKDSGKYLALGGSGTALWTGNFETLGIFKSNAYGYTSSFGAQSADYCHIYTTAPSFYMDKGLSAAALTSRGVLNVGGAASVTGGLSAHLIELSSATPYIDFHFNSSTADYTSRIIESASGRLSINGKLSIGYVNDSYVLATSGFICSSWIRTTGATGWYNESYGGGIHMTDSTWVRVYNDKKFHVSETSYNSINTNGGFNREYYQGSSFGTGRGAFNVAIYNNNNQTPLMVAYRNGNTDGSNATGADRLFSLELLNNGTVLNFMFAGTKRYGMSSTGAFRSEGTITADGDITAGGNITASGEVTAYSDIRLKSNIQDLNYRGRLKPKKYIKNDKQSIGFIAQDIQELYPELVLVGDDENKYLSLNYGNITAVLSAQINIVEDRVNTLENRVNKLESYIISLGHNLPS